MKEQDRLIALVDRLRQLDLAHNPLDRLGVSPAQMLLLSRVAGCPGCRVGELADGLGLTPPTVSVGVRRLERAKLLRRETDAQDQRAIRLYLTTKGQSLHGALEAFRQHKMQQLLGGLQEDEQGIFLSLFEKALDFAESHMQTSLYDDSVINSTAQEDME